MRMRGWMVAAWLLGVVATVQARPNVVLFLADDLGYGDLGCYDCPDTRTPHIDGLAEQGVRMTHFYANATVCTPTRCALMTGRYQQRIGGLEWAIYLQTHRLGLPPRERTLARMLRDAGYATAMSGKWHLGYRIGCMPNHHGFEEFFGLLGGNHDYFRHRDRLGNLDLYRNTTPVQMEGYSTDLITDHAVAFLKQMAAEKDRPFFLYVPFNAPHWPIQGPEDKEVRLTPQTWSKGTRETYVKMVERMDAGVGRVLETLAESGLKDDTLVIFTSDNGGDRNSRNAPFSNYKTTLWEGGLRVPCILRWPGHLPSKVVSYQAGITMDLTATILKLAGAEPPADRPLDGADLMPILTGASPERSRVLFWRRVDHRARKTHRAMRDQHWKCIEDLASGEQHLYHLVRDPGETKNLAEQMPEKVATMKVLMDLWEAEVDPPLYARSGDMFEK